MARQPKIFRPIKLTTVIPEDLKARLDLYLFSPLENKIPYGAHSKFLAERIREFFDRLDSEYRDDNSRS